MGLVVAAWHLQLERIVALKFMVPERSTKPLDAAAVDRFMREARAAARLRGENIAQVLDIGALSKGVPYIVMEYLQGTDLRAHMDANGTLPITEAVDLILQVCMAMAEAHQNGIVHRDLKPENLFLTQRPDGRILVKVLDFGISKLFPTEGQVRQGHETTATQLMGTPRYMSPEQARSSRNVDARADIWSLGVILYELLSGELPYGRDGSLMEVLAQLLNDPPQPLELIAPNLPYDLCRVVDRCLAKNRERRHDDIGAFALGLEAFASEVGRSYIDSVCATMDIEYPSHKIDTTAQATPTTNAAAIQTVSNQQSASTVVLTSPSSTPTAVLDTARESAEMPAESGDEHTALLAALKRMNVSSMSENALEELGSLADTPDATSAAPITDTRSTVADAETANWNLGESSESKPDPDDVIDELMEGPESVFEDEVLEEEPEEPEEPEPPPQPKPGIQRWPPPPGWWQDTTRIGSMLAVVILGTLTVMLFVTDSPLFLVDRINDTVHELGHIGLGWAETTYVMLGGTLYQLMIPLAIIGVLMWIRWRTPALVVGWWLGQNLVHIAIYMADAPERARSPIAGNIHAWHYLFSDWGAMHLASTIASAIRWTGLAFMILALVLLIHRAIVGFRL